MGIDGSTISNHPELKESKSLYFLKEWGMGKIG
jgi:hypothetical protein